MIRTAPMTPAEIEARNTEPPRKRGEYTDAASPARKRSVDASLAADIEAAAINTDAKARRGKLVDRTAVVSTRVQPETRATLAAYAAEHGTTLSDLVRDLADGLALRIRSRQKA